MAEALSDPFEHRPAAVAPTPAVLGAWAGLAGIVLVHAYAVFGMHPFAGPGHLAHFEDDFFYYAVTAEHLLRDGVSSFDGRTLTNGYHPLWFVVLLGVGLIADLHRSVYFGIVLGLVSALTVIGYVGMRRLLHTRLPAFGWAEVASVLYFWTAFRLAKPGMEVALVVALVPWFLERLIRAYDAPRAVSLAGLGFLTSVVVLSRLDMAIFAGMAVLLLAWRWWRDDGVGDAARRLLAFGLGGALLPAYAAFNLAVFGGVMPLSGVAKGLVTGPGFSFVFLGQIFSPGSFAEHVFPTGAAVVVALALGLMLIPAVRRRVHPVLRLLLVLPFVYHGVTALRSDWFLWPWYFYTIALAMPVALVVVLGALPSLARLGLRRDALLAACVALGLVPYVHAYARSLPPADDPILAAALRLRDFAASHPGVYAMGDRAGKVGYLLDAPVIQLEGLVADRKLLTRIRAEANLIDVLREYGVDYYVATNLEPTPNGCFLATEPRLPGPRAPRMRAEICAKPEIEFSQHWAKWDLVTQVFRVGDLRP